MERGKSAGVRDAILVRRGEREARVARIRWHDVFWSIEITASAELRGEMGNGCRIMLGLALMEINIGTHHNPSTNHTGN